MGWSCEVRSTAQRRLQHWSIAASNGRRESLVQDVLLWKSPQESHFQPFPKGNETVTNYTSVKLVQTCFVQRTSQQNGCQKCSVAPICVMNMPGVGQQLLQPLLWPTIVDEGLR